MAHTFRRAFAAADLSSGAAGFDTLLVGVGISGSEITERHALKALAALKRLDKPLLAPLP